MIVWEIQNTDTKNKVDTAEFNTSATVQQNFSGC